MMAMCTEIFFQTERVTVSVIGALAKVVGGRDKIVMDEDCEPLTDADDSSCLCGVNVEKTLKPFEYVLSQWEHGCDWTARKPAWLVEMERRERDRERYESAMAEMRSALKGTPPHA
jgi:hypothetical protein